MKKRFLFLALALCMIFTLGLALAEGEPHSTTVGTHAENCVSGKNGTAVLLDCADCFRPDTCEAAGYYAKHCAECGNIIEAGEIDNITGHQFVSYVQQDATCMEDGFTAYSICENEIVGFDGKTTKCGAYEVVDGVEQKKEVIPARGYHGESVIEDGAGAKIPDECGVYDSCVAYCKDCGEKLEESIRFTVDHGKEFEETIPGSPATCQAAGKEDSIKCTKCGVMKVDGQDIPRKEDHDWVLVPGTSVTDCTEGAYKAHYICSYAGCDAVGLENEKGEIVEVTDEDIKIAPANHVLAKIPAQEPDCGKGINGWKGDGLKCTICGTVTKDPTPIVAAHVWQRVKGYPATCTTDGMTDYNMCTSCGLIDGKAEAIPAYGHVDEDGLVKDDPFYTPREGKENDLVDDPKDTKPNTPVSCTKDGYQKAKVCPWCGEIRVPAKTEAKWEHKLEVVKGFEGTPPTCINSGRSALKQCVNDGCTYKEGGEKIAKLGHSLINVDYIEPTCTTPGRYAFAYCNRKDCHYGITNIDVSTDDTVDGSMAVQTQELYLVKQKDGIDVDMKNLPMILTIAALGHDEADIAGKAATCTDTGREGGKYCKRCGEITVKPAVIPVREHALINVKGKAATCTEAGWLSYYYCSYPDCTFACSAPVADEVGDSMAIGMDFEVVKKDGVLDQEATNVLPEVKLDALNHAPVPGTAKPATCTEDGNTAGVVCGRCYVTLEKQEVIKATGHDMVTLEGTGKAPTCTEKGYEDKTYCANNCGLKNFGDDGKTPEIRELGHDYENKVEYEAAVAPTCDKPGSTAGYKCGREGCDTVLIAPSVVPATGEHNWEFVDKDGKQDNKTGIVPATDTVCKTTYAGYNICKDCGTTVGEKLGGQAHNLAEFNDEAPSCTKMGLTGDKQCQNAWCDYHVVGKVVPALGHSWVSYYGYDGKGAAATCTEDGWTEGTWCERCQTVKEDEKGNKLESMFETALGHDWKDVEAKAATCTEDGHESGRECQRCDAVLGCAVIPATNHPNAYWKEEYAPTYDSEGLEVKYCPDCDTKIDARLTDKLTSGYLKGDMNKDGRVSMKDVMEMLKYLAGTSTNYSEENGDINGDGNVTMKDVFLLLQMV